MAIDDFSDAALVLVGHGSTSAPESSAPTHQHADELRRRRVFAQVRECFLRIEPGIGAVLRDVSAPRVFIVPMFISEGYFTEEVIPRELGLHTNEQREWLRVRKRGGQTLCYCGPIGTHESMTGVILARARDVVETFPFPRAPRPKDTALFIAGHGTCRNENSRKAIERQVEIICTQNLYAEVHPVFLEEQPQIGDCYTMAQARNIVMVPFFISGGLHSCEDIPVLLGEPERVVRRRLREGQPPWRNPTERKGKLVWYARSIGSEPHVADVILERVKEGVKMEN